MKIGIVTMGISNTGSLMQALVKLGATPESVSQPHELLQCERLILPGVGAFAEGMQAIRRLGLQQPLEDFAKSSRPMLGICLGMQLMFEKGHELGIHPGLGIIRGEVKRLVIPNSKTKLPHMGWADVKVLERGKTLFGSLSEAFYFLHSYVGHPDNQEEIAGTFEFGGDQVAAISRGRLHGVQFHPEKSGDAGLNLLERFLRIA